MHAFFALDPDFTLRRGTAVPPVLVPPPHCLPGRIQHRLHPPPLFRLSCGDFLVLGFYKLERLAIFMIIIDFRHPQTVIYESQV